MRVTSITEYHPAAGVVVEFTADVTGDAQRSPIPPSFNQRFHLGDLGEARRVWIAGTFDVPGRIDVDALAWAFTRLIDRHDTLRSSFVQATDGLVLPHHLAECVAPVRSRSRRRTGPNSIARPSYVSISAEYSSYVATHDGSRRTRASRSTGRTSRRWSAHSTTRTSTRCRSR